MPTRFMLYMAVFWGTVAAPMPASTQSGGGLYGTLKHAGGSQLAAGVELQLSCPGFPRPGVTPTSRSPQISFARTDTQGAFTLRVPTTSKGRCELRARGGEPIEVFVSDSSLKYDLEIDSQNRLTER